MKKLIPFILLLILLLVFATAANAQRRGSMVRIDGSISVARVNDYVEYCYHRQYKDNWCWAACVQMVLDYYGLEVTQSRIVERAYGDAYDFTADGEDIVDAIDRWNVNGSLIRATSEKYKSAKTLIDAMTKGTPLIIGLDEQFTSTGHAYVLTHVFFTTDYRGNMTPTRVLVVNPANEGDLEESLDWDEFYERINTIIIVTKS